MQINSTVSFTGKKPPKKPKTQNKGLITAGYASTLAAAPTAVAHVGAFGIMKKVSQLTPEETVMLRRGAREGLRQSGLYDKGVRIYRMQEVPLPKLRDVIQNFGSYKDSYINGIENAFVKIGNTKDNSIIGVANTLFKAFIPVKFTRKDRKALNAYKRNIPEKAAQQQAARIANLPEDIRGAAKNLSDVVCDSILKVASLKHKTGLNSSYLYNANKIITPDKSLQTSSFHEMGHALNNNGGVILKALRQCRPVAMLLPGIVLTAALLNKRKTTDEQLPTDSKFQRLKDFVKRNAGKLTALAFVPTLLDEGLASLRGGKIAKDLFKDGKLTKEILNKVNKTNMAGFATYVLTLVGAVAAAKISISVKDKVQAKYEAKQEAKYQAKLNKYNQKMAAKALKNTTQA